MEEGSTSSCPLHSVTLQPLPVLEYRAVMYLDSSGLI